MRINTNISSINAQRNLAETNASTSSSMQKLSSGFRINRAADDAAGLGIANKLRADTRAMTQANRNAEQANSLLQIAEGSTGSVQKMLERMKELATQAGSDSVDDAGRTRIQEEFTNLRDEINRTVDTTKFQGKKLLNNSFGNSVATASSTVLDSGTAFNDIKVSGATAGLYTLSNSAAGVLSLTNGSVTQTAAAAADGKQAVSFSQFGITVETTGSYDADATAAAQGGTISIAQGSGGGDFLVSSSGDYTGQDLVSLGSVDLRTSSTALDLDSSTLTGTGTAQAALAKIDTAISKVATALGQIGAAQNRIEYAMSNLKTSIQNFSAAESVIRDLDMAEEMSKFSKNNILSQAGTAMLAQANQSAQGVLQLLRG
ncbi:MAG TPA: flagellin [Longimicrobiaceae bacterium]